MEFHLPNHQLGTCALKYLSKITDLFQKYLNVINVLWCLGIHSKGTLGWNQRWQQRGPALFASKFLMCINCLCCTNQGLILILACPVQRTGSLGLRGLPLAERLHTGSDFNEPQTGSGLDLWWTMAGRDKLEQTVFPSLHDGLWGYRRREHSIPTGTFRFSQYCRCRGSRKLRSPRPGKY